MSSQQTSNFDNPFSNDKLQFYKGRSRSEYSTGFQEGFSPHRNGFVPNGYGATQRRTKKRKRTSTSDGSETEASYDSAGKEKSFHRVWVRFAEKTSMQGIPYIHSAKLLWAKVIWAIMTLIAIAAMIAHLYYLISQFYAWPMVTKISLGFDSLRFPDVTICNTNIIKQSELQNLQGAENLKQLVQYMSPSNLAPDVRGPEPAGANAGGNPPVKRRKRFIDEYKNFNFSDYDYNSPKGDAEDDEFDGEVDLGMEIYNLFTSLYMDLTKQERAQIGHNITDMLISCTFDGRTCETGLFRLHQTADFGNCWTLSSNKFISKSSGPSAGKYRNMELKCQEISWRCSMSRKKCHARLKTDKDETKVLSGSLEHNHEPDDRKTERKVLRTRVKRKATDDASGLQLVLYMESMEYIPGVSNGYGARLTVSEPGTYPYPSEEGLDISSSMETSIGLKMVHITRLGTPYSSDGCEDGKDFAKKYNTSYSRRACNTVCHVDAQLSVCGCFEEGSEEIVMIRNSTAHPCRSEIEVSCLYNVTKKYKNREISCDCLNPCVEIQYEKSWSQRQWPSDSYADVLLQEACLKTPSACDTMKGNDARELNYNFLKLNIYYEDLNFEKIEEDPEIETTQFLSDVGGAIVLWIGLSVLAFCEIFQLIAELIDYGMHKLKKNQTRDRRKEKERRRRRREKSKVSDRGGGEKFEKWPHTEFDSYIKMDKGFSNDKGHLRGGAFDIPRDY